jgi:murein DD-endopeptidase MepM/ murein hydrolase activator NlpD
MPLLVFPVDLAAHPSFSDTFGAPRPPGRTHEGTDVFAPEGTKVFAVDVGRVEFHPDEGIGGNVAYLHSSDRTRYVYSHLSAFEGESRRVQAGDLIGYVGHTGNAASTPPHVHFEVHPLEGGPVNPFDSLKAARDQAHPEAPPAPAPEPATPLAASAAALSLDGDGIVIAVLLYLGFRELGRRRRAN